MTRNRLDYKKFTVASKSIAISSTLTLIHTEEELDASYRELAIQVDNEDGTNALDAFALQVQINPGGSYVNYITAWGTENNYVIRATADLAALALGVSAVAHVILPPCNGIKLLASAATAPVAVSVFGAFGRI